MSYARVDGKDTIIFMDQESTKEAAAAAPVVEEKSEEAKESAAGEQDQAAAFDPETGEINWDCPCLGGMAQGPCGEEFKKSFSCFVYSEAEPKGVDCVENFRAMQDCFRQHPDIYGNEIDDDDDDEEDVKAEATEKAEA
ncbi:putative ATP-dependent RNA helicase ucp12 [Umbelopsis sp. WA50703]